MLEWMKNAWLGWQQYTEKGKVVALFLAVLLFLWFGQKWKEQRQVTGRTLFCYSVVMSLLSICPVTAATLMMYQTRFYDYQWIWSMVPVTMIIAWGGTIFLSDIWEKYRKTHVIGTALLTLGLAGILFLCGGLGQRDGLRDAEGEVVRRHAKEVLAEVTAYVQENNGALVNGGAHVSDGTSNEAVAVCLWAPQEIMEAARSYSGEIRLPYGRNMWDPALNAYVYETYDESLLTMYQWMNDTDELVPEAELIEELRPTKEAKEFWRTEGATCLKTALGEGVNSFLFPGDLDAEYVEWLQVQLQADPIEVQGYYLFCPEK
ncbi:MAG: hypothetical protein II994_00195 [Lachnospiraceae bacterium]|nr:hypothetical protein [Lachnospiraceae bacterium]